jgi:hypothetical protein
MSNYKVYKEFNRKGEKVEEGRGEILYSILLICLLRLCG